MRGMSFADYLARILIASIALLSVIGQARSLEGFRPDDVPSQDGSEDAKGVSLTQGPSNPPKGQILRLSQLNC